MPSIGANAAVWRVEGRDLLVTAPDPEALRREPTRYGTPVLFPFPNRLRDGRYTHAGVAALTDPGTGRRAEVEAPRAAGFRAWHVRAPEGEGVASLEPYTCATDALNLHGAGVDAGLLVLSPGEAWRARVALTALGFARESTS